MKKKFDPRLFFSPPGIFVIYIAASCLVILGFRFIYPGETAPIPFFSRSWRMLRGLLDFIALFPALAMSALVIPFGRAALFEEEYTRFSPKFFQTITGPVMTAISAAVIYGLLFFLALPLLQDREANIRSQGSLYRLAREQARIRGGEGEWPEASRFIAICERIWPNSPEMENLKNQAIMYMEGRHFEEEEERAAVRAEMAGDSRNTGLSAISGQPQPVNVTEALTLGETAFEEERYFEAHWLATLGGRLAKPGSLEAGNAAGLAGRAWNRIQSLAPGARESRLYSIFRLKQSGYEALVSGDHMRAYYVFQELLDLSPDDPDAANFFAKSKEGLQEAAFFLDELEMGEMLNGAVFSLPVEQVRDGPGRAILRFTSLSTFADYSFGLGFEYMNVNGESRPVSRLEAPYTKILPLRVDSRPQTVILMRALDRYDKKRRWEPSWSADPALPPSPEQAAAGDAQILLDISYEDFLLLSRIRRGLDNLQMGELFSTARNLGSSGYLPQVFEAEMLFRLSVPLFFLPMAILAIIAGWRFRAKKRPRYLFIPMLPLLPLVFNSLVHLYRNTLNTLGIWLVLSLGFSTALFFVIVALALFFIISLILLAAQHG
jgi:hypothetical protein